MYDSSFSRHALPSAGGAGTREHSYERGLRGTLNLKSETKHCVQLYARKMHNHDARHVARGVRAPPRAAARAGSRELERSGGSVIPDADTPRPGGAPRRCGRRGATAVRLLGVYRFVIARFNTRRNPLSLTLSLAPASSSARRLLQVDVAAEAAISASTAGVGAHGSFSVGESCVARVWCRGESAWEGSEGGRAHNCVFSPESVSWMPLSSPFNTAISFTVSSFCLSSNSSA